MHMHSYLTQRLDADVKSRARIEGWCAVCWRVLHNFGLVWPPCASRFCHPNDVNALGPCQVDLVDLANPIPACFSLSHQHAQRAKSRTMEAPLLLC